MVIWLSGLSLIWSSMGLKICWFFNYIICLLGLRFGMLYFMMKVDFVGGFDIFFLVILIFMCFIILNKM